MSVLSRSTHYKFSLTKTSYIYIIIYIQNEKQAYIKQIENCKSTNGTWIERCCKNRIEFFDLMKIIGKIPVVTWRARRVSSPSTWILSGQKNVKIFLVLIFFFFIRTMINVSWIVDIKKNCIQRVFLWVIFSK